LDKHAEKRMYLYQSLTIFAEKLSAVLTGIEAFCRAFREIGV